VANTAARKRLDATLAQVQRGVPLGQALRRLRGFPLAIVRLCDVGEATGRLGQMLGQAGRRQEMATLEQIDRAAKIVGPALILALGALVGALMAGVLSALTEVGSIVGA
jgi:type II secretory pathway component PulF